MSYGVYTKRATKILAPNQYHPNCIKRSKGTNTLFILYRVSQNICRIYRIDSRYQDEERCSYIKMSFEAYLSNYK